MFCLLDRRHVFRGGHPIYQVFPYVGQLTFLYYDRNEQLPVDFQGMDKTLLFLEVLRSERNLFEYRIYIVIDLSNILKQKLFARPTDQMAKAN